MTKNKLMYHDAEITAIMNKHTKGDRGMAVDMFLANIRNHGDASAQYDYTATAGYDYASLKPLYKELSEDKPNYRK